MRSSRWVFLTLVFAICTGVNAEEEKKPDAAAPVNKPLVRHVQVQTGNLQFGVQLDPGVPEPGQVVDVAIDLAELPPVPDPIYGERIPVKGAELVAEVTDADGAGASISYLIHPLQDAGAYGFHFTPQRRDVYRVTLKGTRGEKPFQVAFRASAGVWPLYGDSPEGGGEASRGAGVTRGPAVPSGLKVPAKPAGAAASAATQEAVRVTKAPLVSVMERMGMQWARAGTALLTGRRADVKEALAAAKELGQAIDEAKGLMPSSAEYGSLMGELADAARQFEQAADSGNAKAAITAYDELGTGHCNRCHFKLRWNLLNDLAGYPAELP